MSHLTIHDLDADATLDKQAMRRLRGGLTANIANPQMGNQNFAPGFGLFALNLPISIPVTVLTEVNPVVNLNLDLNNLLGAAGNVVG